MHMSNLLWVRRQGRDEMAAKHPAVGIAHPTVVPTNLGRAEEGADADERADDPDERTVDADA